MSQVTAYAAQTAHLAAAVIRHVADGIDLLGTALNPPLTVNITAGTTRRVFCDEHRVWEAAVTMYAHNGDPTDAHAIGEYIDCPTEEDER